MAVLPLSFVVTVLGLLGLTWAARALLHFPALPHPRSISLHDWIAVLQLVFASVAGAGALVALIAAYRRQRVAEADSAHDRTRVFNERFTAIAGQLGDTQAAVRLAGIHAMAGLADDWPEHRQTCVDVLCAYLRMPYAPDPGQDAPAAERLAFGANREVRHTVIRVIAAHLRPGTLVSWQGLDLDFTGVQFDGGDFTDAEFSGGRVHFIGATFCSGTVNFGGARFSGGTVAFGRANFAGGRIMFRGAKFSGSTVAFGDATFSGGEVSFAFAQFSAGNIYFSGATFSGGSIIFGSASFAGAELHFRGANFSGCEVRFGHATFSGGRVSFTAVAFSGGSVSFSETHFSGGLVDFGFATFSGSIVSFAEATFSGGDLDFRGQADWSHPPIFDFTGAPPPGIQLPKGWTP